MIRLFSRWRRMRMTQAQQMAASEKPAEAPKPMVYLGSSVLGQR